MAHDPFSLNEGRTRLAAYDGDSSPSVMPACRLQRVLGRPPIEWTVDGLFGLVRDRGVRLVTTGAYRYFRHPVYATLLACFDFGLAILLIFVLGSRWISSFLQIPSSLYVVILGVITFLSTIFTQN